MMLYSYSSSFRTETWTVYCSHANACGGARWDAASGVQGAAEVAGFAWRAKESSVCSSSSRRQDQDRESEQQKVFSRTCRCLRQASTYLDCSGRLSAWMPGQPSRRVSKVRVGKKELWRCVTGSRQGCIPRAARAPVFVSIDTHHRHVFKCDLTAVCQSIEAGLQTVSCACQNTAAWIDCATAIMLSPLWTIPSLCQITCPPDAMRIIRGRRANSYRQIRIASRKHPP